MIKNSKKIQKKLKENKELLEQLSLLIKKLDNKCFFVVFGGFAIDTHYGALTRFHDDVDLICWRKDVNCVRKILKKLNYNSKIYSHPKEKKLFYKFSTTDKRKTFSFQIADRTQKNKFEISFWPYTHLKFPIKYLLPKWKKLENIRIPVVDLNLLIALKKKQIDLYKKTKKINREKYLFKQLANEKKALHDLKLMKK